MFRLPWKVHGVSKGPPHNLLVAVEHTHLLEVYRHAVKGLEAKLAATPKPTYSNSPGFVEYQKMEQDRRHYYVMINWLERLEP